MNPIFLARAAMAGIAAAVLAVGLFASPDWLSSASADDKKPVQSEKKPEPKLGTREATEAAAQKAEDAYTKYQTALCSGTEEEKKKAMDEWGSARLSLATAMDFEVDATREVREAEDNLTHYKHAYERAEKNGDASTLVTARNNLMKARESLDKVRKAALERVTKEIKSKFTYEGESSKNCPPEGKKKKKKDRGEASGGLDFLGNISIGVGVGGGHDGHHRDKHDSRERDREDEETADHKDDKQGNVSRGSGCGHGAAHSPDQDKDDDKPGREDDDD